jgi:TRAP-type C4-dicarboxylate transport system permease small subunit
METLPPEAESSAVLEGDPGSGVLKTIEKIIAVAAKALFWVAGAGLVAMLAVIVADIIGIKVFSNPVPGGIEIVSFLAVIAVALAVPFTQVMRGHVAVDFIVEHFPRRVRTALSVFTGLLSLAVMGFLTYYSFDYAGGLRVSGEVSMTQNIPFYPFVYAMAVAFLVTFVVLALELVRAFLKAGGRWTR